MIKKADHSDIVEQIRSLYGIPEGVLEGFHFYETGKSVWCSSVEIPPEYLGLKKVDAPGMRAFRKVNGHLKPTTFFLQVIGCHATRNIVCLQRDELESLLKDGYIRIDRNDLLNGYVVIRYEGSTLGCGLYRDGRLKSQFPRGRTEALARSGLF
ncbi:MAG: hypothetical protein D6726_09620 [Nitrospirae bacterium]|nr:MAG: hypothetical protein D6726_09620 [Nitrospirota bacterium]